MASRDALMLLRHELDAGMARAAALADEIDEEIYGTMRKNGIETKMVTPPIEAGEPCPRCGRADTPCRPISKYGPNAHFCISGGLTGEQTFAPAPNEIAAKVAADPEVAKAEKARAEARARFDVASSAWETAVTEAAEAKMLIARDEGQWDASYGWRPKRGLRKRVQELHQLEDAVAERAEQRETAHRALVRANERLRVAHNQARLRAGGSIAAGEPLTVAGPHRSFVPVYGDD